MKNKIIQEVFEFNRRFIPEKLSPEERYEWMQRFVMYTVEELNEIERKKMNRINNCVKSYAPIMRYRELIDNQRKAPSNYKKELISGNTAIYLASPICGLKDYNKSVFFGNNPVNLEKSVLINQLIAK